MNKSARIRELRDQGKSYNVIHQETGIPKSTIAYHCKNEVDDNHRFGRRTDWDLIKEDWLKNFTFRELNKKYGVATKSVQDAVLRGILPPRERKEFLIEDYKSRASVRRKLINLGEPEYKCSNCGLVEWIGEVLSLHIHHKNGVYDDNRIENLEWLCPNCHSLTDSYGGKNRSYKDIGEHSVLASEHTL